MKRQRRKLAGGSTIALGTVLVNMLLFLGIPLLLRSDLPEQPESYEMPVLISRTAPPLPPEEPPRQMQPKEKPPAALKKAPASRTMKNTPRPRLNIAPPPLELGMSSRITTGLALSALDGAFHGYEIGDVDVAPRLFRKVDPVYPFSARRRQITGKVTVRFLVNTEGRVQDISIQESIPPGVFDQAVLQAVKKWRFKPGILEGEAVSTWVVLPLEFDLT